METLKKQNEAPKNNTKSKIMGFGFPDLSQRFSLPFFGNQNQKIVPPV